jgi:hypothetical protein
MATHMAITAGMRSLRGNPSVATVGDKVLKTTRYGKSDACILAWFVTSFSVREAERPHNIADVLTAD